MQEGLGQWSHECHGISLCFSTSSTPPQMNYAIDLGTRDVTPVSSANIYANSQAVSNNAGPGEGIDFTRKPVQKPKRKKHRPKVIKEGKSTKTQKSATPKPPKEEGNQSNGKRKYVRKNGLNLPKEQPPSEGADIQNIAEPIPARSSLNFNEEQENADIVLQAQVTEIPTDSEDPHVQVACHRGGTSSSISASVNPMANVQELWADSVSNWGGTSSSISASVIPMANVQELRADSVSNGVTFDLNYSINHVSSKCANVTDSSGQFFRSTPTETVQIYQLPDFHADRPGKSVSHLNISVNQMQNSSPDFGQYVGAAQYFIEKAPRPKLNMMPENPVAHPQHTDRVSVRENSNPKSCTRESSRINQMVHGYRLPESPTVPSRHSERVGMNGNLNEFDVKNDYSRFATNQNNHNGASFGLHDSCDISPALTIGKKREHNAINCPPISFDMNLEHSNSARPFRSDPHSTCSQTSYFTETSKKIRSENHSSCLNGDVGSLSSSSAYFPSNWNTNEVTPIKSGICTLTDVRWSMALAKSQCYQQMIGFGMSEINMAMRPNMVPHEHTPHNTSDIDFCASPDNNFRYFASQHKQLPESAVDSHGENNMPNNIQRIVSHQLQSLETRRTLHYSTDKGCVALPDKQSRYLTAEHTQLPSGTENPLIENYILSDGIQLHYLEKCMVKRPYLVQETHNGSTHDDTVNNHCIAFANEQIRNTHTEAVGQPISESTRTEQCFLDLASGETKAANTTKKAKVRGHPRKKEETNVKRKGRGIRKENVGRSKCIPSKDRNTHLLNNEHVSCGSKPFSGITPKVTMSMSERNEESTSSVLEITDHDKYSSIGSKRIHAGSTIALSADPLDAIIQKLKLLYISKSDEVVAAISKKGKFGALVPFEGNAKKKQSRAKVNIDPVTALMWNLLMAPDMSDGAEGMDKDKEKWLDEERRVFRGRIDSFIARMHLVQGDRRFSPWKGSVVDSVVGVFLTQNVSDHLSSSAFMAVAAKFPVKSEGCKQPAADMSDTPPEQKDNCSRLFGDSIKLQGNFSVEEIITPEFNEGSNSNEFIGSFSRDGVNCKAGECSDSYRNIVRESGIVSVVEAEDGPLEDAISSQNSAVSSQDSPDYLSHSIDPVGFSSLPYFTEEDYIIRNLSNGMTSSTTYAEHPPMQDLKNLHNKKVRSSEYHEVNLLPVPGVHKGVLLDLNRTYQPVNTYDSNVQNSQFDFTGAPYVSHLDKSTCTGLDRVQHSNLTQSEASFYQFPSATMANKNKTEKANSSSKLLYCVEGSLVQERSHFPSETSQTMDFSPIVKQNSQPLISFEEVPFSREHIFCEHSFSRNETEALFVEENECSNLQEGYTTRTNRTGGQSGCSQQENDIRLDAKTCEEHCSSNLFQNQNAYSGASQGGALDPIGKSKVTRKGPSDVPTDESKGKKVRGRPKKKAYDWEKLRKEVFCNGGHKQRSHNAKDSVDWEAVRQADVRDISDTIKERGMNNVLAERIKEFLNRLVRDHGSIDLEWLRDLQPDKAKEYLLSIRGLGLKSAECVRLLTLHHMAFPVDTNVARICVRLGWVPLQPLPESLQLHLLELYPMLEHIQKYLWPRLCKLDQLTLYELHYQMITFGKVFCTKSKPNCNSCPMRAECKHFASAFASARLSLPGPEEKSLIAPEASNAAESCHQTDIDSRPLGQHEWNANQCWHVISGNNQPIIEEPSSPEPEPEIAQAKEASIEDLFSEDPNEVPTINLNMEQFTQNLKNYMEAKNIQDADMSKALVAITPEAASIPTPKLKNVSRLRTEHRVYELPDSHPLLEGFDRRQPDDPCPYLLSIWTPGETAQSTDAPKTSCNSEETGKLCESSTCFSCNSVRELQTQRVRATILIPCRTAMRGSFPLNGTYFQVNELFADHYSSQNPIDVPRSWIWNLPRRTVYFGTSIPTIFRGLTTEEIQQCFWRGFVCVRGFDRALRAPRPLYARLHFPASKVTRVKRHAAAREEE